MVLAYQGSSFSGWQSQRDGNGIQNHLENALKKLLQHPIPIVVAGRTDAGVHALKQCCHFDMPLSLALRFWSLQELGLLEWEIGSSKNLQRCAPLLTHSRMTSALQNFLPRSVAILALVPLVAYWQADGHVGESGLHDATASQDRFERAEQLFHARFSAKQRNYRYALSLAKRLLPWEIDWVAHCWRPLDELLLHQAMQQLLGEHDFSFFRASHCQARSPVRTVLKAEIKHKGHFIYFDFSANAFLHHMVRNMVGACLMVATRQRPLSWLQALLLPSKNELENQDLSPQRAKPQKTGNAITMMPAAGLYLTSIDYGETWQKAIDAGMDSEENTPSWLRI